MLRMIDKKISVMLRKMTKAFSNVKKSERSVGLRTGIRMKCSVQRAGLGNNMKLTKSLGNSYVQIRTKCSLWISKDRVFLKDQSGQSAQLLFLNRQSFSTCLKPEQSTHSVTFSKGQSLLQYLVLSYAQSQGQNVSHA